MPEEIFEEPWYRCCRCRTTFKLKTLIIRHLILHKVHRFENDSDAKCIEDWERVRVSDGNVVKVHLQVQPGSHEEITINQHPQTAYVISDIGLHGVGGEDNHINQSFVTPFGPSISQTPLIHHNAPSSSAVNTITTTEDQIFKCRYCLAPFALSRSRAVHEAKVHNDEINGYPCQICQKNFPTIASVQDHYRCTHKQTPPVKKTWKLWKTHGGDINDYAHPPGTILPSHTQSNFVPLQLQQQLQHHEEQDETVHTLALHPVCREVVVMGVLDESSQVEQPINHQHEQQQQFESYYFHAETGPIAITTPQQQTSPSSSSPKVKFPKSNDDDQQGVCQPFQHDPNTKKRGKKTRFPSDSTSSLSKKNNNKTPSKLIRKSKSPKSSTSPSSSLPTKLPKDSPFRYQRLKCTRCETRFRTQWEMTVHLGDKHAEYSCEFCSLMFRVKDEMLRHQYSVHNTELGVYQCHFCVTRINFGSPRLVQEHVHLTHPEVKVPSTSVALKWRRA